jgi:hypothetical protein
MIVIKNCWQWFYIQIGLDPLKMVQLEPKHMSGIWNSTS